MNEPYDFIINLWITLRKKKQEDVLALSYSAARTGHIIESIASSFAKGSKKPEFKDNLPYRGLIYQEDIELSIILKDMLHNKHISSEFMQALSRDTSYTKLLFED